MPDHPSRGRFITLEGVDGAGKSTHARFLAEALAARGKRVVATREPGGTPAGEAIREWLLHRAMTHETEALLMFAARREHVVDVIEPALARGDIVLCDRFTDATYAYQGAGHGVPFTMIDALAGWVHGDCNPDLTLLFDVPGEVSRERLARSHARGKAPDKFERETHAFFERVRSGYLARAAAEPRRFRIIDSSRPLDEVRAELRLVADAL
ncbi:MAG TPA: dTMP kinase [Casimicrobiaceae bacterium]|nr:dTMP kinase [Casimicrobiaceae bacterium]